MAHLIKRMDLFNGRRVVALVGDESRIAEARELLAPYGCEFVRVANNPNLREVSSFDALFQCVETTEPGHATFWCHNKGGLHGQTEATGAWAEMMWEQLDFWHETRKLLEVHPVCGMFKKLGRGFDASASRWHYSGSFFWFRNQDLFLRDWQHVDRTWFGIETYPSLHFHHNNAGCLFGIGTCRPVERGGMNLYDEKYTIEKIKPAWEAWKREHVQ